MHTGFDSSGGREMFLEMTLTCEGQQVDCVLQLVHNVNDSEHSSTSTTNSTQPRESQERSDTVLHKCIIQQNITCQNCPDPRHVAFACLPSVISWYTPAAQYVAEATIQHVLGLEALASERKAQRQRETADENDINAKFEQRKHELRTRLKECAQEENLERTRLSSHLSALSIQLDEASSKEQQTSNEREFLSSSVSDLRLQLKVAASLACTLHHELHQASKDMAKVKSEAMHMSAKTSIFEAQVREESSKVQQEYHKSDRLSSEKHILNQLLAKEEEVTAREMMHNAELYSEIEGLKKSCDNLSKEASDAQQTLGEAKRQLECLKNERKHVCSAVEPMVAEILMVKRQFELLIREKDNLSDQEIVALTRQLEDSSSEIQALTTSGDTSMRQFEMVSSEKRQESSTSHHMKEDFMALTSQLQMYTHEREDASRKAGQMAAEIVALTQQLEDAFVSITQMEAERQMQQDFKFERMRQQESANKPESEIKEVNKSGEQNLQDVKEQLRVSNIRCSDDHGLRGGSGVRGGDAIETEVQIAEATVSECAYSDITVVNESSESSFPQCAQCAQHQATADEMTARCQQNEVRLQLNDVMSFSIDTSKCTTNQDDIHVCICIHANGYRIS